MATLFFRKTRRVTPLVTPGKLQLLAPLACIAAIQQQPPGPTLDTSTLVINNAVGVIPLTVAPIAPIQLVDGISATAPIIPFNLNSLAYSAGLFSGTAQFQGNSQTNTDNVFGGNDQCPAFHPSTIYGPVYLSNGFSAYPFPSTNIESSAMARQQTRLSSTMGASYANIELTSLLWNTNPLINDINMNRIVSLDLNYNVMSSITGGISWADGANLNPIIMFSASGLMPGSINYAINNLTTTFHGFTIQTPTNGTTALCVDFNAFRSVATAVFSLTRVRTVVDASGVAAPLNCSITETVEVSFSPLNSAGFD